MRYRVGTVVKITKRSNVYFYWQRGIPDEFEYNRKMFFVEDEIKKGYLEIYHLDDLGSLMCRGYPSLETTNHKLVPVYKDEMIRIARKEEFTFITLEEYVKRPIGVDKFEINILLTMLISCCISVMLNDFYILWFIILFFGFGSIIAHHKSRKLDIRERRIKNFNDKR